MLVHSMLEGRQAMNPLESSVPAMTCTAKRSCKAGTCSRVHPTATALGQPRCEPIRHELRVAALSCPGYSSIQMTVCKAGNNGASSRKSTSLTIRTSTKSSGAKQEKSTQHYTNRETPKDECSEPMLRL